EYGDVWMPVDASWVADGWADLQRVAAEQGRDPATLSIGIFNGRPDLEHLAERRELGAEFVALGVRTAHRAPALANLDSYAPLVGEFNTERGAESRGTKRSARPRVPPSLVEVVELRARPRPLHREQPPGARAGDEGRAQVGPTEADV